MARGKQRQAKNKKQKSICNMGTNTTNNINIILVVVAARRIVIVDTIVTNYCSEGAESNGSNNIIDTQ